MAPVSSNDQVMDSSLLTFAQFYARGEPVRFAMNKMPRGPPQNDVEMQRMESVHKVSVAGVGATYIAMCCAYYCYT